jgi:hypothetical protein
MMSAQICKLCRKNNKLIKAHIVPDFLYRHLGLYQVDLNNQKRLSKAQYSSGNFTQLKRPLPTGEYDNNILCSNCDNCVLQKYEDYGKKIFFDGSSTIKGFMFEHKKDISSDIEFLEFSGIDLDFLRLFVISIFWKASISNREFCQQIQLDKEEEEVVRKMLLYADPKTCFDYPIVMYFLDGEHYQELITDFKRIVKKGQVKYALIVGGMVFLFYPERNKRVPSLDNLIIGHEKQLRIIKFSQETSAGLLQQFMS